MSTTTQPMTAEELFLMPKDECRYELVRGEIKKMAPAGFEHGVVIAKLTLRLAQYVEKNNLGVVCGAETGFHIATDPDTVRAPDIGFVSQEHLSRTGMTKKFFPGAPNLAVEVVSPGDTVDEIDEWLTAGASAVWVVNPKRRGVTVYRSPQEMIILGEDDELDGHDVVPGFRCRVSEIFI